MNDSKEYWEGYYKSNPSPSGASPFAKFVAGFLKPGEHLYELGCGNGRDSVFFASFGVNVVAFDQCQEEVDFLNQSEAKSNLKFKSGDFTDLGDLAPVDYVYSRFTLHSVNSEQEQNTLHWIEKSLLPGGLVFIEIRSVKDELFGVGTKVGENEFVTTHYRRFVEFDPFVKRVESTGLKVLFQLESKGLAPYKNEDPVVIRVIAQK